MGWRLHRASGAFSISVRNSCLSGDGSAADNTTVDVGDFLAAMTQSKGGEGNYQTSVVDLLKLLNLDSSLEARKSLAQELGVHVGAYDSAEQNVARHKAVMAKLAENGGKIPEAMKG